MVFCIFQKATLTNAEKALSADSVEVYQINIGGVDMAATNSTRPLIDLAIRKLKTGVTLADTGENRGLRVSRGKTGVTSFV